MPTVEAILELDDGTIGRGLVPSGASTGQYEALELRDGDAGRFRGKSVARAISHVRGELAEAVIGMGVDDQAAIDRRLIETDGTPTKSRLGANALLGISLATADAAARVRGVPLYRSLGSGTLLPMPEVQVFGGGAHADWRTDVQDYLVIPTGADSFAGAMEIVFGVYHAAGDLMREAGKRHGLADEGGYWPDFRTNAEPLDMLVEAIERAGYTPGVEAAISLDIAASDLYDADAGRYRFRLEKREFTSDEFADLVIDWCDRYPILSIEDPAADVDWDAWRRIRQAVGDRVQLVGDDLFTTNIQRIQRGIDADIANCVLIKLNQIGTVTETLDAIALTQKAGWLPLVSVPAAARRRPPSSVTWPWRPTRASSKLVRSPAASGWRNGTSVFASRVSSATAPAGRAAAFTTASRPTAASASTPPRGADGGPPLKGAPAASSRAVVPSRRGDSPS